jgi:hypothetical protein
MAPWLCVCVSSLVVFGVWGHKGVASPVGTKAPGGPLRGGEHACLTLATSRGLGSRDLWTKGGEGAREEPFLGPYLPPSFESGDDLGHSGESLMRALQGCADVLEIQREAPGRKGQSLAPLLTLKV